MEVIPYEVILRKARKVSNDINVKKVLRLIGLEQYVVGRTRWLWDMERYRDEEWMTAITSKKIDRLLMMVRVQDGSPISQMMLGYSILKAAYPDTQAWIEIIDDTPVLRFDNIVVIPYGYRQQYSSSNRTVCTAFDAMELFTKSININVYKKRDIMNMMGETWNYRRVREGVLGMLEPGSDIRTLGRTLNIKNDDLLRRVEKASLAYRACDVFDYILSKVIPFGCIDPNLPPQPRPVYRSFNLSDIDIFFFS